MEVISTIKSDIKYIKGLNPGAQVGIRGSLVRGTKGPHKNYAPFDSDDYDIDIFIVSVELADYFPPNKQLRDVSKNPDLAELGFLDIQKGLAEKLHANPLLGGFRDGTMNFRIMRPHESEALLREANNYQAYILFLDER